MKYYIVSESQLDDLYVSDGGYDKDEADMKCRIYEVNRVSTFDPDKNKFVTYWEEV